MRVIGVFLAVSEYDRPLVDRPKQFMHAYWDIFGDLENDGFKPILVRTIETFLGDSTFSEYWVRGEEFGVYKKIEESIKVDVLLNKSNFNVTFPTQKELLVVNSAKNEEVLADKDKTYEILSHLMPSTEIANSEDEFSKLINGLKGETVAVKGARSNGGKEVLIDVAEKIKYPEEFSMPLSVQQFIDSSEGIPGVCESMHDFRVYILGGEVIGALLRTPKEGSLLSNTNMGGSMTLVDKKDIPGGLVELVQSEIDPHFNDSPRFYSADFMFDGKKWWLIELNSKPGVLAKYQGDIAIYIQGRMVKYLSSL